MDFYQVLVGMLVGGMTIGAFAFGKGAGSLARMEISAAVNVAKQEVGWEYQRYRIQALRMDWVALPIEARKEYVRVYGRPQWAARVTEDDPLEGVPHVLHVVPPSLAEARA